MQTDNSFILRFFDEDKNISPESFSGKELGELIISFHEGLKELIDVRYPEIDSNTIKISLVGIEDKSESLLWKTSGEKQVTAALLEYGTAILKNTYTDLPHSTYKSVKNIFSITKRKKCNAELVEKNNRLFVVTPKDKLIKQENVLLKSDMLIYGVLNKLGGDKSRAWVELYDGSRISFPVTDEQLILLKVRLKEPVALKGKATWSAISKQVIYFKISEVIDYKPQTVVEGFDAISSIASGWDKFNSNTDIVNFLKGNA